MSELLDHQDLDKRSANLGDYFILLLPELSAEPPAVSIQRELRTHFGGKIIDPVHVTCDRFELPAEDQLAEISDRIEVFAASQPPFSVDAVDLQAIRGGFRGGFILKWLIERTEPLNRWLDFVSKTLDELGMKRHYRSLGDLWTDTALQDICVIETEAYLEQIEFPQHLFTVEQVILSMLLGQGNY